MTYSNTDQRAEFIAGLRALADFLEVRPEVPAPTSTAVTAFPRKDSDAAMFAEVAAFLGTRSTPRTSGTATTACA